MHRRKKNNKNKLDLIKVIFLRKSFHIVIQCLKPETASELFWNKPTFVTLPYLDSNLTEEKQVHIQRFIIPAIFSLYLATQLLSLVVTKKKKFYGIHNTLAFSQWGDLVFRSSITYQS